MCGVIIVNNANGDLLDVTMGIPTDNYGRALIRSIAFANLIGPSGPARRLGGALKTS